MKGRTGVRRTTAPEVGPCESCGKETRYKYFSPELPPDENPSRLCSPSCLNGYEDYCQRESRGEFDMEHEQC